MPAKQPSLSQDAAHVVRGLMMGAADVVPGVSGGTVALIVGIYERLVTAISHFDARLLGHLRRREWSAAATHLELRFLVALGCGILLGVGGLAKVMKFLLEHHREWTLSAFFGLILASSVLVARMIGRWGIVAVAAGLIGAAFGFWITGLLETVQEIRYGYLFLCGMIAICAMILPGISGSFILMILGLYKPVLDVLSRLIDGEITLANLTVLGIFACGCAVGLLTFSKLLRWLLARHRVPTMALLCGFMVGSLRGIWPFKADKVNVWPDPGDLGLFIAIGLAAMAFVFVADSLANRRKTEPILESEDHEPLEPPAPHATSPFAPRK